MSPSLADVLIWNPAPLATQATTLSNASTEAVAAADTLSGTLDILPAMWTGVAATATRDALRHERTLLTDFAAAVFALSEVYATAHNDLVTALGELHAAVDSAAARGITVDTSAPASGPISLTATAPADTPIDTANLRATADVIAAAAAAVLDADNAASRRINDAVTTLHNDVVPAADGVPLDALMETHSLAAEREGDIPGLGADQDNWVRDRLSDAAELTGARAVTGAIENVADNRQSAGDAALDVLSDVIPGINLPRRAGQVLSMAEFIAPDVAENFDIPGIAVDLGVRPAARWADDHIPGSHLFINDDELADKLERDQAHQAGAGDDHPGLLETLFGG